MTTGAFGRKLRLLGQGGARGLLGKAELTATALSVMALAGLAHGTPRGERVVRGDVRFERRGNETLIYAGRNSIINYSSFDIARGETVRFVQPDAAARVLNRIQSAAPTRIDGSLMANGRVYLVNPAGVYFGQGAVINVNGLYAGAATMTDRDFLRGIDRFTSARGSVVNEGTINANFAALVGAQVANSGSIIAPQGTIVMASGRDVLIGRPDGNVYVRITRPAANDGQQGAAVSNTGDLNATGGRVSMVSGDVLGAAMFNSGRIKAAKVAIDAQGRGSVVVQGEIDATNSSGQGGQVSVLGETISLEGAKIDASGAGGGGLIQIGGGFQGRGTERTAQNVSADGGTVLRADATGDGDAGRVVVWSDETTRFDGTIEARALGQTGAGGVAEVSGKQHLSMGGHAYLQGKTASGELLLDPGSVDIIDGPNAAPGGTLDTFNDGWIIDQLNTGGANLTISTANSTNAGTQDLTVNVAADLTYNSTHTLTLIGNNSVTIDGTISNAGTGGVAIQGGSVSVNNSVSVGGGFTSTGTSFANSGAIVAGGAVTLAHTGTVDINANVTGTSFASVNTGIGGTFDSTAFTINAGSGAITISHAGDAVTLGGLTSSGGAASFTGANVTQTGTANVGSYDINATGLVTINGGVTATGAAGFEASGDGFVSGASGTITASNGAGRIQIDSNSGNVTIGAALQAGSTGITITALGSGQIAQGASATAGSYTATAGGQFSLGGNIATGAAGVVTIQSGTSGSGDLVLGSNSINADTISLRAGDGASGGNSARINLVANPTFRNSAGTARPDSFSFRQDASIVDADLAGLARFQGSNIGGMDYLIRSDAGSITNSTATKLNTADVTLVGQTGVTLAADLSVSSLDVTGATTLSADVSAGSGSIAFHNSVALGAATRSLTGGAVSLDAGASGSGGGLTVANSGTLTIGGAITLTGAGAFQQTGAGQVDLNAGVTTQNQNISFDGAINLGANAELNAGTALVDLNNSVDLASHTFTLTGDEIDLGSAGSVSGTGGSIVLQPSSTSVSIGVGAGAGTLSLGTADLAALGTGISSVTIGRASGAHAIDVDGAVFRSATTFRASSGGSIVVNGQLTGTGAASLNLQGTTTLNADIQTAGQAITISGNVLLDSGQSVYTLDTTAGSTVVTGANISISGTVNGDIAGSRSLSLAAGSGGDISTGAIGSGVRLANLNILSANDATIAGVTCDNLVQAFGTGVTSISSITAFNAVNLNGAGFTLGGVAVTGGNFGMVLNNSGASTLTGTVSLAGPLFQVGSGGLNLGAAITTQGVASFAGPVTLVSLSSITTNNGAVTFSSTLDGTHNLAIVAGTGDVSFAGDIGASSRVGDLAVTADDIDFLGSIRTQALDANGSGNVRLHDDATALATLTLRAGNDGAGDVVFNAPGIDLSANAITLRAGTGGLGGTARLTLNGANAPTFHGASGGATAPASLSLTQDAAFLDSDLPSLSQFGAAIDGMDYSITSRLGRITISDPSRVAGTQLALDAFNGVTIGQTLNVASFSTPSAVLLTGYIQSSAGDIDIGGTLTLAGGTGGLNAGTGGVSIAAVDAGANDFIISADSLALNGGLFGSGVLVLQPFSSTRDIVLGGGGGNPAFELTSAEIGQLANGWSEIFIGRDDSTALLRLASAVAFIDPVTLRMQGAGGRMDIAHRLGGADNASLRFLSGGNITLSDEVVTSGNAIDFVGPVVIQVSTRVDTTDNGLSAAGADISFRGLVDAIPGGVLRSLNITSGTSGAARLTGEVGFFNPLDTLTYTGAGIQLAKTRTLGAQTYNGNAFLSDNVQSLNGGDITFSRWVFLSGDSDIITAGGNDDDILISGGIDSFAAGSEKAARLNAGFGSISIGEDCGRNVQLGALGLTAAGITSHGVRSLGNVIHHGDTQLTGDVTGTIVEFDGDLGLSRDSTITASSSATFGGTIVSAVNVGADLTVASPVTTFVQDVGQSAGEELGTLATTGVTNIAGIAMKTLNGQSYGGAVQINNDVTFTAGSGGVAFNAGLDGNTLPRALIVNTPGETFFGGSIGDSGMLASISTTGGGTIRVAAPTIRTTNSQDYASAVLVDDNTSFIGNSITFSSTIDSGANGPKSVQVNSSGGGITFGGAIGATSAIAQFDVTATTFTLPSVRTTAGQTYNGNSTLTGNLVSTQSGVIALNGTVKLMADVNIASAGGTSDAITITGAVDAQDTSHSLVVNAGQGNVTFGADIGLGQGGTDRQLTNLAVVGGGIDVRRVQTTGSQIFNGATTLHGNLTSTVDGSLAVDGPVTLATDVTLTTALGGVTFGGTIDSDSTARSLTISTGGSSQRRFGGSIGATSRLTTLTLNNDGTTRFEGATVRTSGAQNWNGPVTLASNLTFEAPTITFLGTVDSDATATPRALIINTAGGTGGGTVTFSAALGSTFRLQSLQVAGTGTSRLSGNVSTTRGTDFGGPVKLLAASIIDGGSGTLLFRSSIDTEASLAPTSLSLLSTQAADPDRTPFKFGGNIGSSNALSSLSIGADLGTPARAATIVFSDGFDSTGRVLASSFAATDLFTISTSGNFTMGAGQKILSFGRLRINAGGSATLGDLVSLADITVNSSDIRLRARPVGSIFDNVFETPTDVFVLDTGSDIVSAGSATFSSVPTVIGSGAAPVFATNTGLATTNLQGFSFRRYTGGVRASRFADTRSGGSSFLLPLDLRAEGASSAQLATSLAGALPRDVTPGVVGTPPPVSPSIQSSLAEMGIQTRSLTVEETIDYLVGRASYDDLRPKAGIVEGDYRIATTRLSAPAARRAVEAYRDLIYRQERDTAGNPLVDASGNPVLRDRTGEIKAVLARAWSAYASKAVGANGPGFRAYLENRGGQATTSEIQALRDLNDARNALTSVRAIGLSEFESSIPRRKITDAICPDTIPAQVMVEAIFGAPIESLN